MPPDLNCFSSLSGTILVWRWNFSVIFWTTGNRTLGDNCKSVSCDKVWIAQRTRATLEQPRSLIKMSSWPEALLRPVLVGPKFAIVANTNQVFRSANKDQHLRHLSLQAWYAWLKDVKPCKNTIHPPILQHKVQFFGTCFVHVEQKTTHLHCV